MVAPHHLPKKRGALKSTQISFLRVPSQEVRSLTNAYKEMHDAQMHDNKAFNARRVLQRLKELDQ